MILKLDLSKLDDLELRLLTNYLTVRGAACEASKDWEATIEMNAAILTLDEARQSRGAVK